MLFPPNLRRGAHTFAFSVGILAWAGTALAADPPKPATPAAPPAVAAPAAVSSDPATTSATFGDWVLNCQRMPEGTKPARVCEVVETIQVQGQQAPIARIALGRLSADKPLSVTAVLPTNISFPSTVHIGPEARDKGRDLTWTRCLPVGCFAEVAMTDDVIKAWRAATDPGKLTFKDAGGREVGFAMSFRGLSQALDALAKES